MVRVWLSVDSMNNPQRIGLWVVLVGHSGFVVVAVLDFVDLGVLVGSFNFDSGREEMACQDIGFAMLVVVAVCKTSQIYII
ncbi:hypothetical protein HanPSC8_Chr02g0057091 [Helianthus annuus]|nr:hypothetical protein HanPSC8_Chr02g0057091 [Helianthus annuus]